jgi:transposase
MREDVVEKRKNWKENQKKLDVSKLKFLDEMSVNCGMTRLYGRAFSNERVNDYVPDVRFERTSIIGALGSNGIIAPMVYKGTMNGELFGGYVELFLAPVMKKGDTLILDSLSAHKVVGVLDSLIEKGVTVLFQPRYSPDFNPIEKKKKKIKAYLRKVKARTHDTLVIAIGEAIERITESDIQGWVKHCGYGQ